MSAVSEHITPLLRELHWLKVPERIQFRLCVLACRCLICTAPSRLAETLHSTADVGSRRRLRSASTSTLVIPSTRHTTLGDRAFPVTAARAWNALPSSVRSAPSLRQFRRDLKTALFQSSYSSPVSSCVGQTVTFNNTARCPCNGLVREVSP